MKTNEDSLSKQYDVILETQGKILDDIQAGRIKEELVVSSFHTVDALYVAGAILEVGSAIEDALLLIYAELELHRTG